MSDWIETKALSSPVVYRLHHQHQVSQMRLREGKELSVTPPCDCPSLGKPSSRLPASLVSGGLAEQAPLLIKSGFVPRIEKHYKQIVCFDLLLQCSLNGVMSIPSPTKIVLSNSSRGTTQDKKELVVGLSAALIISGQKPQATWAKRSIAGFKLREGEPLGCKVTLRGRAIYTFFDRLANIALPRGRLSMINHAINGDAAYYIGIGDPFQFYELEHHFDLFQSLRGFDVALLTTPTPSSLSSARAIGGLLWSGLQLLA